MFLQFEKYSCDTESKALLESKCTTSTGMPFSRDSVGQGDGCMCIKY